MSDQLQEATKANGNGSIQARANSREDYSGFAGSVFHLVMSMASRADGFIPYSYFPAARDAQLRQFWRSETIMAGGVYNMVTRVASIESYIESDQTRKKKQAETLLEESDFGQGLHVTIEKLLQDVLTQDNGAFLELGGRGRAGGPLLGPVTRIAHLDSQQCFRTFNPEYPVIYQRPDTGAAFRLHKTRVLMFSQLPSPAELARGIGYCAVSRALYAAQYMRNVLTFKDEKVSGKFTRALGYGRGFNRTMLEDALAVNEMTGKAKGYLMYRGIPFLMPPGNLTAEMELKLLDLASLGDGFNYLDELTSYVYMLALAFGTDARDFWPATVTGATKGDATVQNMKSRGKAYAELIKKLEIALTRVLRTISPSLSLKFDFVDDDQDEQQAKIHQMRAATISEAKREGFITPQEGRAQLIAQGVLVEEVLEENPELTAESKPVSQTDPSDELNPDDIDDSGELIQRETKATRSLRWLATQKAIQATRLDFEGGVEDILLAAQAGDLNRTRFSIGLRSLIKTYSRKAFLDGLSDGGVDDGVIEGDDAAALNAHVAAQSAYVTNLGEYLFNSEDKPLDNFTAGGITQKAVLWFNNSIYPAYELGRLSADANGLYEWVLGAAEKHCEACPKLAGQKHRLKLWHERELIPKAGALPCNGGCKCSLVKTTGRSSGRFI